MDQTFRRALPEANYILRILGQLRGLGSVRDQAGEGSGRQAGAGCSEA